MKVASIVLNAVSIAVNVLIQIIFAIPGTTIWISLSLAPSVITCIISIIVIATSTEKNGGFIFQGIMDLLFGSMFAGIFMLCIDAKDLKKPETGITVPNGEKNNEKH